MAYERYQACGLSDYRNRCRCAARARLRGDHRRQVTEPVVEFHDLWRKGTRCEA